MEFRTQVPIKRQQRHLIDYDSNLFLVGSCFSDSIGEKFLDSEFNTTSNPLGVLFHPLAIERFITRAINEELFNKAELFFQNDLYCSLEAHSQFNSTALHKVVTELNQSLLKTRTVLKEATHVFITLGTSWVYRHVATDTIAANCHKIPQKQFLKELLSVETVKNSLEAIVGLISDINPETKFIFTLSPVRHLKDGFVENNRSKSHLMVAVQELVEDLDTCFYFPSYELVMDELRDYRFYNKDMVHPSEQAINYIWEQFIKTWLTDEAIDIKKEIRAYKKGLEHKPFNPHSSQHQTFLKQQEEKRNLLLKKVPHLNL